MKESVIRIHFLPCACPASKCKSMKHLVRNSSVEVCVFHSQFCVFEEFVETYNRKEGKASSILQANIPKWAGVKPKEKKKKKGQNNI